MKTKLVGIMLVLAMMCSILAACQTDKSVDDVENPDNNQQEGVQGDGKEDVSIMLNLIVNGVSEYVIVRGENASPSEVTAAAELQAYLKKISGAELPIVTDSVEAVEKEIVVGKTNRESDDFIDRAELGDDGFVIKSEGQKLYLVGGEKRGTLYSVYTFLEEYLGVRFYTATIEKIPELKTVSFDNIVENKQIPVFEYRDIDWVPSRQGIFQAKLKANGTYAPLDENYGGHYSYIGFVHTLNSLVPPSVYYAEHPEYYSNGFDSYAAGEADPWGHGQPCLSNPEVLKIATASARQWLIDNPHANIISISQDDNQRYCTCDECNRIYEEEGSQAGVLLRFVNAIATELGPEFPNVKFDTLAYQYTRTVPKITKPVDNVVVRLCTIECCFSHPLGECDDYSKKEESSNISDDIKAWGEITDSLYVWDYVTNYAHTNAFFPNFSTMLANAKFFADNNVIGLYEEANYFDDLPDFPELRAYILGKIMWDPYMSNEEYWGHIDDFLEGVYGPGWQNIRAYIDICQEQVKDKCFNIYIAPEEIYVDDAVKVHENDEIPENLTADMIINYTETDWSQFWNFYKDIPNAPKLVTEGEKLFAAAYEMAQTDEQRAIIDKASITVDYVKSTYLGSKLTVGGGDVGKILSKFISANSDALEGVDKTALRIAIIKFAREQVMSEYIEFNRKLVDKMISYGFDRPKETTTIYGDYTWSSWTDSGSIRLDYIPNDWYD